MAGLTTHVLDTSIGKPAYKILIELYSINNNVKNKILECSTNKDGRVDNPLISNDDFTLFWCDFHSLRNSVNFSFIVSTI